MSRNKYWSVNQSYRRHQLMILKCLFKFHTEKSSMSVKKNRNGHITLIRLKTKVISLSHYFRALLDCTLVCYSTSRFHLDISLKMKTDSIPNNYQFKDLTYCISGKIRDVEIFANPRTTMISLLSTQKQQLMALLYFTPTAL